MEYITILGVAVVVSAIVGVLTYLAVKSRAEALIRDAEAQAEMIKKEKALQAKEKFIQLKSEHDRAVNERNQKIKEA
ncbi:MAG: ribonuclease Y, partial [Alistipes sp.]|nr:ribonuclease Y [Alistipes sp.]